MLYIVDHFHCTGAGAASELEDVINVGGAMSGFASVKIAPSSMSAAQQQQQHAQALPPINFGAGLDPQRYTNARVAGLLDYEHVEQVATAAQLSSHTSRISGCESKSRPL